MSTEYSNTITSTTIYPKEETTIDLHQFASSEHSTQVTIHEDDEEELKVFGYPGSNFYVIHISALVSLFISIVVSSGVLIYLMLTLKNIWRASIGERLVVYLSLCDLLYSVSHSVDHIYMLVIVDHPPDMPCAIMGIFLVEFVTAQLLFVTFIATNAFVMVVKEKRIPLGKRDWKLLLVCFGLPAVICVVSFSTNILGPSGAWCFFDARKTAGIIVANIIGGTMVLIFVYNTLSYLGIWFKISQVAKSSATTSADQKKYHKSARTMLFFIAAFIGQWWAYIIFSVHSFFTEPHITITVAAVTFSNMGGVFNFLAYTYVRKKQASVQADTSTTHTTAITSGRK